MIDLKSYLNVYEFETDLPGSSNVVKYKGLTTNLMKKLLTVQYHNDPLKEEDLLDDILRVCIIDDTKIDDMYVSDRYYLLVKIREATKGKKIEFQYKCKECKSESLQVINLDNIIIEKPEKFEEKLELLDGKIVFYMKPPKRELQKRLFSMINSSKLNNQQKQVELGLCDIASYVTKIETATETDEEINYKNLIDFIGDLPEKELENINKWKKENEFGIKLEHEIKCNCGASEVVPIPFSNFFK